MPKNIGPRETELGGERGGGRKRGEKEGQLKREEGVDQGELEGINMINIY